MSASASSASASAEPVVEDNNTLSPPEADAGASGAADKGKGEETAKSRANRISQIPKMAGSLHKVEGMFSAWTLLHFEIENGVMRKFYKEGEDPVAEIILTEWGVAAEPAWGCEHTFFLIHIGSNTKVWFRADSAPALGAWVSAIVANGGKPSNPPKPVPTENAEVGWFGALFGVTPTRTDSLVKAEGQMGGEKGPFDVSMQGVLQRPEGWFGAWVPAYFVLRHGILSKYSCDATGPRAFQPQTLMAQISLGLYAVVDKTKPGNPSSFALLSFDNEIWLRAPTVELRKKWLKHLRGKGAKGRMNYSPPENVLQENLPPHLALPGLEIRKGTLLRAVMRTSYGLPVRLPESTDADMRKNNPTLPSERRRARLSDADQAFLNIVGDETVWLQGVRQEDGACGVFPASAVKAVSWTDMESMVQKARVEWEEKQAAAESAAIKAVAAETAKAMQGEGEAGPADVPAEDVGELMQRNATPGVVAQDEDDKPAKKEKSKSKSKDKKKKKEKSGDAAAEDEGEKEEEAVEAEPVAATEATAAEEQGSGAKSASEGAEGEGEKSEGDE